MFVFWKVLNALAFVLILSWVSLDALGTNVFGKTPWPQTMVDFRINYDFSRSIVDTGHYPGRHSYPPAAVSLFAFLSQLPYSLAASLYLAANIAAVPIIWWRLLRLLHLNQRRDAWCLAFLAHAAASGIMNWEQKSQNCNLFIVLSLVLCVEALCQSRDRAAGLWLAFNFSLKMFSLLLIPYLAWQRKWIAFRFTLLGVFAFWIVLPGIVFGPERLSSVYGEWLHKMSENSLDHPDWHHPIIISIHNSARYLAGVHADRLVALVWGLWFVLGLAGWRWAARRRSEPGNAIGTLTDVSLLTLAPVAVSPYLEPYHLLGFMIPSLVLVQAALDPDQTRFYRRWAIAGFWISAIMMSGVPIGWSVRGLWMNTALFVALSVTVGLSASRRERVTVPSGPRPLHRPAPRAERTRLEWHFRHMWRSFTSRIRC